MPFKPQMSDETVKKATGKNWNQWFKVLDNAKAFKMSHTEIVKYLYKGPLKKGWWCQMVANTYEQYKGLRQKHETAQGYQISVSKTFSHPIGKIFTLINNRNIGKVIGCKIEVTKSTKNKSIRGKILKDDSRLEIFFDSKAKDKTQVVFQQTKLKRTQIAKMKYYWKKVLEKL